MGKLDLLIIRQHRETWEDINIDTLEDDIKEKYLLRKKALDLYIDGVALKHITRQTGIVASEIYRELKRCLRVDDKGKDFGYSALLPSRHTISNKNKIKQLFSKFPQLEEYVLGNYFGDKKYTLENNMNIRTLHTKFTEECIRLGIQTYEYPFTIKDKGYSTLYRYIKQTESNKQIHTIQRENKDAQQKFLSTGYGKSFNLNPIFPYEVVQLDGHKIDLLYTVETENEKGEIINMPATRCWLIAIIDVATRTILGYSISPYENYNQYDVLNAIYNTIVPHKKIVFSHNSFKYPDNGGFPSLAIENTKWATFDMIMLDNAKSHLAKHTLDKLINTVKCSVNFGSIATPETRGIVERFFKTLEMQGFHRLPGTTGSNSRDSKRKEPEKESSKYKITYNDIVELLEYLIAEYNNSAHSSLENQTPLQVMKRRINNVGMKPFIIQEKYRNDLEKLTYFTVERTIRGGYKTGSKPHISYLGVKYHAYDVVIPMDYIGQKAYIEVNPSDVSHVDLYDVNGIFICNLVAVGEWGRRSHSIKMHEAAIKRKNQNLEYNTVFAPHLTEFENDLRTNAKNNRRARTKVAILREEMNLIISKTKVKNTTIKCRKLDTKSINNLSKEEIKTIESMSIEEAYKQGLI